MIKFLETSAGLRVQTRISKTDEFIARSMVIIREDDVSLGKSL
jgi:hypothetical protein